MSLLDDARQLAHQTHSSIWRLGLDHCWSCGAPVQDGPRQLIRHIDHCGLIAMTKIVAALEAAERYVSLNGRDDVSMTDIMHAEDDLHEAFGHARRYDVEEIKT